MKKKTATTLVWVLSMFLLGQSIGNLIFFRKMSIAIWNLESDFNTLRPWACKGKQIWFEKRESP